MMTEVTNLGQFSPPINYLDTWFYNHVFFFIETTYQVEGVLEERTFLLANSF